MGVYAARGAIGGTTRNQQTLEEMEILGGRDQIQFLVDHQHDIELYESDDIFELSN